MIVDVRLSAIRETAWYEYLLRFGLGGAATVVAGLIAHAWGPGYGGSFLAFPAIFSASATLIEKHEERRKARLGLCGSDRGRSAAALDAIGAALGSVGLMAFGAMVSLFTADLGLWILAAAILVWAVTASALWALRQWRPRKALRPRTGKSRAARRPSQ